MSRIRAMASRLSRRGDATDDVAKARRRARRLRMKLTDSEGEVERLRTELKLTRGSVRDPFPDLSLPDPVRACIDGVTSEHLSYLGPANLAVLARLVREADLAGREGAVVEAGTARGGSAIVMASAKDPSRPMKVYDVFDMIPAPSERDDKDVHRRYARIVEGASKGVGGETYYGYRDDLLGEVTDSFARHGVSVDDHNVELVQGLFQDTIDLDEPVAFAHLDGDWYESTMVCLERIAPLLVRGGRIVLDDYHAWSGCRTAVDEYFSDRPGFRLERRAKVHVVRT